MRKRTRNYFDLLCRKPFRQVTAAVLAFGCAFDLRANPHGMGVGAGSATAQVNGSTLTINTSQNTLLNWQSFNIASGETTIFNQPNTYSIVVNNIHDANASQIYGSLQANGVVVLMNQNGFYFGPDSFIKTGGLIVSTANVIPPQNTGGMWEFNGPPPLASIVNYGQIQVGEHGSAFLIANTVENHGTISAPGGSIGLAAGQTVLLSERPDGRGMSMEVTLPQGSVSNDGQLIADAGSIALNARVVNQNGLIQANSVQNQNGVIELVAADTLKLGANSQIVANGDASGASDGGSILITSGNTFADDVGSRISLAGGVQGGNGGTLEICAPAVLSLNSAMDASAQPGWIAGRLSLDPDYIVLDSSGSGSAGSGTVLAGSNPGSTLDLNVGSAFSGFSTITLQAKYDITLAGGTSWDLSGSTGQSSGQLTLQAGRNIIFGDGALLTDANSWSVALQAGYNFVNSTVQLGVGSIYLNGGAGQGGSGSIQLGSGNLNMTAGQDILVGSGYAITTAGGSTGGNITAHALAGSIDTGSDAQGYHFNNNAGSLANAYNLSGGLGGISTEAGGDVTLIAGGDVTSVLPGRNGYYYDGNFLSPNNSDYTTAGAGAYGRTQQGNVTVIAGGNVTGHYLVADGTGKVFAGVLMDANGNPVQDVSGNYVLGSSGSAGTDASNPNFALSLINGAWNVTAAQNIFLQEVRNPNGVFDVRGGSSLNHYFDYSPDSYVNLWAGNAVQLGAAASALPRSTGISIPFIYPCILNVTAGDGGITLGTPGSASSLILFPSALGSLTMDTSGSLLGHLSAIQGAPQLFNLIVSDSGAHQFTSSTSFGLTDHAATPIHLNSEMPIDLNIGGDMNYVFLGAPEAAQITVGGNMNNCRFQGMNLAANDVTSIHVAGDINNASAYTTVDLSGVAGAGVPDLSYLSRAITGPGQPSATELATSFFYNPATGVLTYKAIPGVSLATVLSLLQSLTVQKYVNGVPQFADPPDNTIPIIDPTPVVVLNATAAQALLTQYNIAGAVPNNASSSGFLLGGGGRFDIQAHNIDLGTSLGIQSLGAALYQTPSGYPLAGLFGNGGQFTRGADISINASGNVTMFSSSIASLFGGNIAVNAGGSVSVGSADFTVDALGARGIFTTSGGDVSVIGGGDIAVNGSRISTYDGGNITVESLDGNINAGNGASTPVSVQGFYEDPATHQIYSSSPQLPFSGIVALTFGPRDSLYPAPDAVLGNILVESPNGSISASTAGILQIPLNNVNYPNATTAVLAGYELRDSLGNPVTAANMDGATAVSVSDSHNINVSGSGIIASNARLDASGDINGLVFARNNIDISAQQNVNVTALGVGNVSVNSSGGSISGTIVGVGGVSVSGGSIDASLVSANVSGSTSGQSGLGNGNAAAGASQSASGNSDDETKKFAAADTEDTDEKKKRGNGNGPGLARRTGRVTVLLPPKSQG